jgi:hypothetical protein
MLIIGWFGNMYIAAFPAELVDMEYMDLPWDIAVFVT